MSMKGAVQMNITYLLIASSHPAVHHSGPCVIEKLIWKQNKNLQDPHGPRQEHSTYNYQNYKTWQLIFFLQNWHTVMSGHDRTWSSQGHADLRCLCKVQWGMLYDLVDALLSVGKSLLIPLCLSVSVSGDSELPGGFRRCRLWDVSVF